jgi:uncharacterized membrane protein SirB2
MQLDFLLPFFKWCDSTLPGQWVRGGTWEFPMIETIHILALTMLYGCIVVISLRLMGVMMRGWTVPAITREITPFLNASLAVILISGTLLFLSEASKAFANAAFWVKVDLLFAALVFHFMVVRKVTRTDGTSRATGFVVGLISLVLWLGIGCAGRAIGFV